MSKELDMTCLRNWKMNMWKYLHKRALWKRLYSAKETYHFKEPTNRSHPRWTYESNSTTEPYNSTKEPDISTERALHLHNRARHLHQKSPTSPQKSPTSPPESLTSPQKSPYLRKETRTRVPYLHKNASYLRKRVPHLHKRALHLQKRAPHLCKTALYLFCTHQQSTTTVWQSAPLLQKDSCRRGLNLRQRFPYVCKRSLSHLKKKASHESTTNSRSLFCGKTGSEKHQQKRHTSSPKSPICLQKMPV